MRGTRAVLLAALAAGTLAVGGCGDSGAPSTGGTSGTTGGTSGGTSAGSDQQLDGVTANLDQVEREVDGDGAG